MEPKDKQLPEPNGPGKDTYLRPAWKNEPEKTITLTDYDKNRMRAESYRSDKGHVNEWHDKPEPHHTYIDYIKDCPECNELHTGGYRSRHPQS